MLLITRNYDTVVTSWRLPSCESLLVYYTTNVNISVSRYHFIELLLLMSSSREEKHHLLALVEEVVTARLGLVDAEEGEVAKRQSTCRTKKYLLSF